MSQLTLGGLIAWTLKLTLYMADKRGWPWPALCLALLVVWLLIFDKDMVKPAYRDEAGQQHLGISSRWWLRLAQALSAGDHGGPAIALSAARNLQVGP